MNSHLTSREKWNSVLLTILYSIQAIPLGLSMGTLPILLKARASYIAVGTFAVSAYPYSLKLFWSPIVDSIYYRKLGKRKSWIIPAQTISGTVMLGLSLNIDNYLSDPTSLGFLTFVFTVFTFMSATQDIAVDAWGLDMFDTQNRHLCATCQTVGMGIGFFISYTVFLFLNSAEFCNKYLRTVPEPQGILSLGQYLVFWGCVYLVISFLLFFVPEDTPTHPSEQGPLLSQVLVVYKRIWNILQLDNMKKLLPILLLNRLGTVTLTLFPLHLAGFLPQHTFALSSVIGFPIEMIGVFSIASYIKDKPLDVYLFAYKVILAIGALSLIFAYTLPTTSSDLTWTSLFFVVGFLLAFRVVKMYMFVSLGAFFSSISDTSIGGTYVTLMNTVANFGGTWPDSFVPYLIDFTTFTSCILSNQGETVNIGGAECSPTHAACQAKGGQCATVFDGFYLTAFLCTAFGVFMAHAMAKRLLPLQYFDLNTWSDTYDLESGQVHDD